MPTAATAEAAGAHAGMHASSPDWDSSVGAARDPACSERVALPCSGTRGCRVGGTKRSLFLGYLPLWGLLLALSLPSGLTFSEKLLPCGKSPPPPPESLLARRPRAAQGGGGAGPALGWVGPPAPPAARLRAAGASRVRASSGGTGKRGALQALPGLAGLANTGFLRGGGVARQALMKQGTPLSMGIPHVLDVGNSTLEMDDEADELFLGCSEPSGEDSLFYAEDGERPPWNWDGEYVAYMDKNSRWGWSGVDSWDTYDTEFSDPMSAFFAEKAGFTIPVTYDWNSTTGENYEAPLGHFVGPFSRIRADLDYTYHVNYKEERQRLQDEIINWWIEQGVTVENPWIVFTAGAMGSGKSRALRQLQENGVSILRDMAKVDPDAIKFQLPEMSQYIVRNPGPAPKDGTIVAGLATHNESGYLQELVVRELMDRKKHLVVDGSLADANWYAKYLKGVRQRYPQYRIAILHVQCEPAEVLSRVKRRCVETGRCICTKMVEKSIKRTPVAVQRLAGLVDMLIEVDSNDEEPFVTSISIARKLGRYNPSNVDLPWTEAYRGLVRWADPKFWRRRTVLARRHRMRKDERGGIKHPGLRRQWVLNDEVDDEVQEGLDMLQELFESDIGTRKGSKATKTSKEALDRELEGLG